MNRYYSPVYRRFTSPDPYRASGGPADPGSWNRYAYVNGDPINFSDPSGLLAEAACDGWASDPSLPGPCGHDNPLGSISPLRRIYNVMVDGPGAIFNGWEYANSSGTAFNVSLSGDLFSSMVASGTITLTSPGIYQIGGVLIRIAVAAAGSPVVMTVAGISAVAYVGWLIYEYSKSDIKQVRDAARIVGKEPNCRPAEPEDFNTVQEMIKDSKGPDGKVPWETLLEAWREVLCEK